MTPRRRTLLLVTAALAVHLLLLALSHWPKPRKPIGDEPVYLATAQALATGEASVRPGHEMLWPPLYGRFLALCATGPRAGWPRPQLIQLLFLALTAWLLRDLTLRLLARPAGATTANSSPSSSPIARLAADLVAVTTLAFPPLASYAQFFFPEILHLLLWVALVWMIARQSDQTRGGPTAADPLSWWAVWPWSGLFGLVLGTALLTKSLLQPVAPFLLLAWALALARSPLPAAARPAKRVRRNLRALAAAGFALLVAAGTLWPTLAENHRRYQLWAVANSGPINLWIGLNDTARRDRVDPVVRREIERYRDSGPDPRSRQEWVHGQIHAAVAERGLGPLLRAQLGRQYFRLFNKDSFFTDQLPGGLLHARKRGYRGTPPAVGWGLRLLSWTLYAALLPLIVFGLALQPPRGRLWVWLVVGFVVYNLALFLFVHVKSRYRAQLLPLLLPFAAAAFAHLLSWSLDRWPRLQPFLGLASTGGAPQPIAPRRFALATAISALLLFLAFGGEWLG